MSTKGPTREDFATSIENYWHGRAPASLEDVMALYGVLAVAEDGGDLYLSPRALDPFLDDGRVVIIDADLTGETPQPANVQVRPLQPNLVPKLAYAHKTSGRGSKYSLTQVGSKTGNDAEGVTGLTYGLLGKLADWPTQIGVRAILDGESPHPDGWVIEQLETLLDKESETISKIAETLTTQLSKTDEVPTVMTVRCQIKENDLEQSDVPDVEWFWPADLDVLSAAMESYKRRNAADKNLTITSSGESVDLITGETGTVVGTPESPLDVFSIRHPDMQPGLSRAEAWRNYAVSEQKALLFAKAEDLMEDCKVASTYMLPYFAGEITPVKAKELYEAIKSANPASETAGVPDAPMARVTYHLQESDDESIRELAERELRFYTLTQVYPGSDTHTVAEDPAVPIQWGLQLTTALVDTAHGPTLDVTAGGFEPYSGWPLLGLPDETRPARQQAYSRITGRDFSGAVVPNRENSEENLSDRLDHQLLRGDAVDAAVLFREFMARWTEIFTGPDENKDDGLVPPQITAMQLVYLETLSRTDLLTGLDVPVEPATRSPMTDDTTPDNGTDLGTLPIDEIRRHRLAGFLDRQLFENPHRKAAALSGVIVGAVSWYQEDKRDMGRPLDSKVRGDQLSGTRLEGALKEALDRAKIYALEDDHERNYLFPEAVDELLEATTEMPSKWPLDKNDLQFAYTLGHVHGRRTMPVAFRLRGEANTDTKTETEANE